MAATPMKWWPTTIYVVRIPDCLPLDAAAPLLCAGITVYSALKYFGLHHPTANHVGVAGFGGLGHLAVKFAKALGLKVTVISTSPSKRQEALECFGADSFLDSRDPQQLQIVMVGAPEQPLELPVFPLLTGRKMIAGSGIGGKTEEMLDFAAKYDIRAEIEVIPMDYVNAAMDRLAKGDVRYRFVIDVAHTLANTLPVPTSWNLSTTPLAIHTKIGTQIDM